MTTVNRFLKGRIVEKFGTQSDFADELGICESYVSRIVRRRRKLPEREQFRWAAVLKVNRGKLFKEEINHGNKRN